MLSNDNLEKLQNEIMKAYEQNGILKFDQNFERKEGSTPEHTQTDNTEIRNKKNEDDDKNSFFPISELDGEKNLSFDNNNSLIKELSKNSKHNTSTFNDKRASGNSHGLENIDFGNFKLEKVNSSGNTSDLLFNDHKSKLVERANSATHHTKKNSNLNLAQQLFIDNMPHQKILEKDEEQESQSVSMKDSMSNKHSQA